MDMPTWIDRLWHRARARGGVLGLALGLACGGSSAELMNSTSGEPVDVPPWACVPGETQPCECGAELPGVQTCAADGSAFGECDCSPTAMSQGPQPTGTGTGTGTDTDTDTDPTGGATMGTTTQGTTDPGDSSSGGPDPSTTTSGPDPTTSGGSSGSSTTM